MISFILLSTMLTSNWFEKESQDKWAHIGVSSLITQTSYVICRKIVKDSKLTCGIVSAVAASGVGLAKEYIIDSKADTGDMLANEIGVGIGLGLSYIIEW